LNEENSSRGRVAAQLEAFVRQTGRIRDDDPEFSRHVDLFDSGYLDSHGTVSLIAYIEGPLGASLTDDHLKDSRFSSIDGISDLVASLKETPDAHGS
jgi:acyl carrier protein